MIILSLGARLNIFSKYTNIILSPSDKGENYVIMTSTQYNKIIELLYKNITYEQTIQETITRYIDISSKSYTKWIIKEDKFLSSVIDCWSSKIASTSKSFIPIISGIGCTSHKP